MTTTRDNFTKTTRRRLSEDVDHHCVFPGCWLLTSIPHPRGWGRLVVSQAAHLTAAAENGPDYDPDLTPEQRRALENGANLCATHARQIDVDREMYPLVTLRTWQRKAVEDLRRSLGRPPFVALADRRQAVTAVEGFLVRLSHCPRMVKARYAGSDVKNVYDFLGACGWSLSTYAAGTGEGFTASNPFHAGDAYAATIQLSILQNIAAFCWDLSRADGSWMRDGYDYVLKSADPFSGPPAVLANDDRLGPIVVALDGVERERQQLRAYISDANTRTL